MARMTKFEEMKIKNLIELVEDALEHTEKEMANTKAYLKSLEDAINESFEEGDGENEN